jgi:serine protease Do
LGVTAGLLVENVSGPAAVAGLVPGDVLLAINGHALSSVDQLRAVTEKKPKSVALLVLRGGDRVYFAIKLS